MIKQPDFDINLASQTYSLAPAPPSLLSKTMERIGNISQPRFRPGWLDCAISAVTTGTAGSFLLPWQQIPSSQLARLPLELLQIEDCFRLLRFESLVGLSHH